MHYPRCLGFLLALAVGFTLPLPAAHGAPRYEIIADYDHGTHRISGAELIFFDNTSNVALTEVDLFLYPNIFLQKEPFTQKNLIERAYPNKFNPGQMTLATVQDKEGHDLIYQYDKSFALVHIFLAAPIPPGERGRLRVLRLLSASHLPAGGMAPLFSPPLAQRVGQRSFTDEEQFRNPAHPRSEPRRDVVRDLAGRRKGEDTENPSAGGGEGPLLYPRDRTGISQERPPAGRDGTDLQSPTARPPLCRPIVEGRRGGGRLLQPEVREARSEVHPDGRGLSL